MSLPQCKLVSLNEPLRSIHTWNLLPDFDRDYHYIQDWALDPFLRLPLRFLPIENHICLKSDR